MAIEHSVLIQQTPQHIFDIYKQVDSWPQWDPDIEAVGMDGAFAAGTTGWLKPKSGPKTRTTLVEVSEPRHFTVESKLPLCIMRFEHELEATEQGTRVTHRVSFSGISAAFFRRIVGNQITRNIDTVMQGLKQYAESASINA